MLNNKCAVFSIWKNCNCAEGNIYYTISLYVEHIELEHIALIS